MSIDFKDGGRSRLDFSKSVNSFGPTVFFYNFSRFFLSIRGAISRNEFETKAMTLNQGSVTRPENLKIVILTEN